MHGKCITWEGCLRFVISAGASVRIAYAEGRGQQWPCQLPTGV